MIETKSLEFSYDNSFVFKFPNIKLKSNENLLVLGNSGIGKSTLLHNLAGILRPKSGLIKIFNQDISNLSEFELDKFRGQNIGIIFQRSHFVNSLTIGENLELAKFLGRNKKGNIKETLDNLKILDKNIEKSEKMALIMGSEGEGLAKKVKAKVDEIVSIEILGGGTTPLALSGHSTSHQAAGGGSSNTPSAISSSGSLRR
jgi:ABC-type lipoprotein export system ATPase subunit